MSKKNRIFLSLLLVSLQLVPLGAVTTTTVAEEAENSEVAKVQAKEIPTLATESLTDTDVTNDSGIMAESQSMEDTESSLSVTTDSTTTSKDDIQTVDSKTTATDNRIPRTGDELVEGNLGDDPNSYQIDKVFAKLLREKYSSTINGGPITKSFMESLTSLVFYNSDRAHGVKSLKGLEFAKNLTKLDIQQTSLEPASGTLDAKVIFDVSKLTNLTILNCSNCSLNELDVTGLTNLEILNYSGNNGNLTLGNQPKLTNLDCGNSNLTALDVSGCPELKELICGLNPMTTIDINSNKKLEEFSCVFNNLESITIKDLPVLKIVMVNQGKLTGDKLKLSNLPNLEILNCSANNLSTIEVTQFPNLKRLSCEQNSLSNLTLTNLTNLEWVDCSSNLIKTIEMTGAINLATLNSEFNQISDITFAEGFSKLTNLNVSNQRFPSFIIPDVSNAGTAEIKHLKTTAKKGLNVSNVTVKPDPILTSTGDTIELANVTKRGLSSATIKFAYDESQLSEGASGGKKTFSGSFEFITLYLIDSTLVPEVVKTASGTKVNWLWRIERASGTPKDIYANLELPTGVKIVEESIRNSGNPATIEDINGTNNLGILKVGDSIIFSFETEITGKAEEWLELKANMVWKDGMPNDSTSTFETTGAVQVLDDEQSYRPREHEMLALISTPIAFRYGIRDLSVTPQSYSLDDEQYQTNTKVPINGFYTRIRDTRTTSNGWKLNAKLSNFKGTNGESAIMPNSAGAALKLNNLSIERVDHLNTTQETVVPSPSGAEVPSNVKTSETLVVGQAEKTLIEASSNQGGGTWQLKMPFEDVSLDLPALAGKKGKSYQAILTWSLNDTP